MTGIMWRQGNILIATIDELPAGAVAAARGGEALRLDPWSRNPEAHVIEGGASQLFTEVTRATRAESYLRVSEPVIMTHPVHAPLLLEPGSYHVVCQRVFTPWVVNHVRD